MGGGGGGSLGWAVEEWWWWHGRPGSPLPAWRVSTAALGPGRCVHAPGPLPLFSLDQCSIPLFSPVLRPVNILAPPAWTLPGDSPSRRRSHELGWIQLNIPSILVLTPFSHSLRRNEPSRAPIKPVVVWRPKALLRQFLWRSAAAPNQDPRRRLSRRLRHPKC